MKKAMTILCSMAFLVSGIMMAITASDPSPQVNYTTGYKTMAAATLPVYEFPKIATDTNKLDVPEDLLLDLVKRKGLIDTVYVTKTDTIVKQVAKVKRRKVSAPKSTIEINVTAKSRIDTVQVPVYYLATQIGNKEGPDGCIPVYEVRKVNELCPEKIQSSATHTPQCDTDTGE